MNRLDELYAFLFIRLLILVDISSTATASGSSSSSTTAHDVLAEFRFASSSLILLKNDFLWLGVMDGVSRLLYPSWLWAPELLDALDMFSCLWVYTSTFLFSNNFLILLDSPPRLCPLGFSWTLFLLPKNSDYSPSNCSIFGDGGLCVLIGFGLTLRFPFLIF